MELYQYLPLPTDSSIRIIVLQPSFYYDANLQCKIIHEDRSSDIKIRQHYEPVSYVWGTHRDFSSSLYCEVGGSGRDAMQRIPITSTVEKMLRSLRKPLRPRHLWIDAICLDQSNDSEKETQVPLMGRIYKEGRKTHIFLTWPLILPGTLTQLGVVGLSNDQALKSYKKNVRKDLIHMITNLIQDPWFTRRWVLQEAVLSRNAVIRHRDDSIPWYLFMEVLRRCLKDLDLIVHLDEPARSLSQSILALTTENDSPKDLFELLQRLHLTKCTDPRDRIYSLIGLLGRGQPFPKVDYALHYSDIYAQVALLQGSPSSHPFNLFSNLIAFGSLWQECAALPSWVPAWNRPMGDCVHFPEASPRQPSWLTPVRHLGSLWPICSYAVVYEKFGLCTSNATMLALVNFFDEPILGVTFGSCGYSFRLQKICSSIASFFYGVRPWSINVNTVKAFLTNSFLRVGLDQEEAIRICSSTYQRRVRRLQPNTPDVFEDQADELDAWHTGMRNTEVCLCSRFNVQSHPDKFLALVPSSATKGDVVAYVVDGFVHELSDVVLRRADEVPLSNVALVNLSASGSSDSFGAPPPRDWARYRLLGWAGVLPEARPKNSSLEACTAIMV